MITFVFSKEAEKRFKKIDSEYSDRILKKLKTLKNHNDIFSILSPLIDFKPATHRLRVGNFRLILEKISAEKFLILDIGHRKEIYRIK